MLWPKIAPPELKRPRFEHGSATPLPDGRWVLQSYHPSQQNTFTGRLTEPMFDSVFEKAREIIRQSGS
jgi:uracil-DNA glycosylase